eukprot:gnl/MRDRNA2_/MRDRNA2_120025_c0_seq1.p1 gnl/MRDRNA2_/MRDRNA2_120025_c0~~gnl/MRDRNA2_/MRDRNA2_120025_c0_seq1.p1  ORF type:complete len:432 (-),score=55.30 gnl/MRDRNA2_/MRDRNA2_120025_c0_seq1:235-1500(-)
MSGPKNLTKLKFRSRHDYQASVETPLINQQAIGNLSQRGFFVMKAGVSQKKFGSVTRVCASFTIRRSRVLTIMRLFVPLFLLVLTPFAGLWLPVHNVMPRVATGFISFLALQVFRNVAYSLLPKMTSSLLWIDVLLTMCTQICFLTVIHNIVAVWLNARISGFASRHFDYVGRGIFPFCSALLFIIIWVLGESHADIHVSLITVEILFALMTLAIVVESSLYVKNLPEHIVRQLMQEMTTGHLDSNHMTILDDRELSLVWRLLDKNESGSVTVDEILHVFKHFGLKLPSENAWQEHQKFIEEDCGLKEIYFDKFKEHHKVIFGHHHSRVIRKQQTGQILTSESSSAPESAIVVDSRQGNDKDDEDEDEVEVETNDNQEPKTRGNDKEIKEAETSNETVATEASNTKGRTSQCEDEHNWASL